MNTEELKLNDKELHKCIDELKGTQFLSAFYILDWIIKMRNENEELQERIKKAIELMEKQIPIVKIILNMTNINTAASELLNYEKLLKILRGED